MFFLFRYMDGARTTAVFAVVLAFALLARPACAVGFHAGGAGNCNGCHSMHSASSGSTPLLLSADPSSICLNCHAGLGGASSPSVFSSDGSALTPGGDFYWLTRSFSWLDGSSPGYEHGHNIVAADFNLTADPVLDKAPGGSFSSATLACTSCHDPHGQVGGGTPGGAQPVVVSGSYGDTPGLGGISGNYRLLGGANYQAGGWSFSQNAPIARQSGISPFLESDSSHVAYGSGMSEWCGNCHQGLLASDHSAGGIPFRHPAGNDKKFTQADVDFYNSYLRSGDFSGTEATAYLQFVPFERGVTDIALLDPQSTRGPDTNSNVMCLSCHRAHASAFANIGRWDFTASLLVDSHPAVGDVGVNTNDTYFSYYGRDISAEFGSGQGQFCEKCHGASTP